MKRRALHLVVTVVVAALAGCGGGHVANPPQLWIAPNGDELHVKLQPIEPNPF